MKLPKLDEFTIETLWNNGRVIGLEEIKLLFEPGITTKNEKVKKRIMEVTDFSGEHRVVEIEGNQDLSGLISHLYFGNRDSLIKFGFIRGRRIILLKAH
jgi:hypothetical protein